MALTEKQKRLSVRICAHLRQKWVFLPAFIFFSAFPPVVSAHEAHVTLLFTNDHHGQVEPIHETDPSKPVGGVARRMALIEKIRGEVGAKNVILVDGGDLFTGTALSGLTRGEVDCAAYQLMQYDAIVLGNHDFDYGKKAIQAFRKDFRTPWISANVVSGGQPFMKPYVLKSAGVRVGLIGFSNPDTPHLTRRENVLGLVFNPPGQTAKGLHSIFKKDADIFVVLSHLGVDGDVKFAKDNPFIHVIIGGHSHTVLLQPIVTKAKDGSLVGPIICQAGSRGLYLGRLDLTIEGHRDPKTKNASYSITDYHYQLIPITADLPEDPRMTELLDKYKAKFKAQDLDQTLADLSGDFSLSSQGDSPWGDLAADAIRQATQTQAAFVNSGAFRSDFKSGTLTRANLYEVYPFDDSVVTMEVPGSFLKSLVELSYSKKGENGFLQVSGLTISKKDGELEIEAGKEPLQSRQKYRIAVNDFLAEGGDGYEMFRRVKSRVKTEWKVRDLLEKTLLTQTKVSSGGSERRWNTP